MILGYLYGELYKEMKRGVHMQLCQYILGCVDFVLKSQMLDLSATVLVKAIFCFLLTWWWILCCWYSSSIHQISILLCGGALIFSYK